MGRAGVGTIHGLLCPDCATDLEISPGNPSSALRLQCPGCGGIFRALHKGSTRSSPDTSEEVSPPVTLGDVGLRWRALMLTVIEQLFWWGTLLGSMAMILAGGIFPVLNGWLRNEVETWGDVVRCLGGVWFRCETSDPDADLGPVLSRVDAPLLFTTIEEVARKLGVRPPGQVRLSYLPCCGVAAWGRSRALLVGLPLLRVLNQAELRAVLAHELAHLARGDASRAARSARFVESLEQALERLAPAGYGPLRAWARFCHREAAWLIEPVARGQEARADRLSALIAGGGQAASALVKVAMVQPLFREVLEHYDAGRSDLPNLYAFFRAFWFHLPVEVHSAMRLRILTSRDRTHDPAHPPLPDRLALLQSYPDLAAVNGETRPATTFLGDLDVFEQMLHNRLFGLPAVEPTVFHRAGS